MVALVAGKLDNIRSCCAQVYFHLGKRLVNVFPASLLAILLAVLALNESFGSVVRVKNVSCALILNITYNVSVVFALGLAAKLASAVHKAVTLRGNRLGKFVAAGVTSVCVEAVFLAGGSCHTYNFGGLMVAFALAALLKEHSVLHNKTNREILTVYREQHLNNLIRHVLPSALYVNSFYGAVVGTEKVLTAI